MSLSQTEKQSNIDKLQRVFILVGVVLIGAGVTLFGLIFQHVFTAEAKYTYRKIANVKEPPVAQITPVNHAFDIIIPEIGANAPVIANVDPYNSEIYQEALSRGIAHAKGSVFPDVPGTVFLFAHSAENFYEANKYNAIFYLLNKLKPKDDIILVYKNQHYTYKVTQTKIVDEDEVNYLSLSSEKKRLILMTCWPPGTSLKRLLVFAEPR